MIYIFTALYPEARPLIQYFKLGKDANHTRFQVFYNEEHTICLAITGTGSIAAATAVASIFAKQGRAEGDFLVNIGTCADMRAVPATGKVFLCNKIIEQCTGKTFYPDLLYRHTFAEAGIVTGAKLLDAQVGTQAFAEAAELYDMEAAAIYQAGSYFVGPHQMSFLKIVSDAGEAGKVTAEQAEKIIGTNIEEIAAYIRQLCDIADDERQQEKPLSKQAADWIEKLTEDLHCSKVMKDSLRGHIKYLELTGCRYEDILREMYANGELPCKDKREGKVRFEELKRKLL